MIFFASSQSAHFSVKPVNFLAFVFNIPIRSNASENGPA
jgi:hypothetical protein